MTRIPNFLPFPVLMTSTSASFQIIGPAIKGLHMQQIQRVTRRKKRRWEIAVTAAAAAAVQVAAAEITAAAGAAAAGMLLILCLGCAENTAFTGAWQWWLIITASLIWSKGSHESRMLVRLNAFWTTAPPRGCVSLQPPRSYL